MLTLPDFGTIRGIEAFESNLSDVRAQLQELDTATEGRPFSDEQQADWELLTERKTMLEDAVQELRKRHEFVESMSRNERNIERTDAPRRTVTRAPQDIFDLAAYRNQAQSVDDLPELYQEGAKRAIDTFDLEPVQQTHITRLLRTIDNPGELARRILATGSPVYQRAFGKLLQGRPMTNEETRALSTYGSSGADGGYAVPVTLDPTVILTSDGVINPLRQISRVESITNEEWNGVSSTGVTVSRVAENTAVTANNPTFVQPRAIPTAVKGLIEFSIELGQDWGALQAELGRMLADAKDTEESASFVVGTGNGLTAPQGIERMADTSIVWTEATGNFGVEDVYALMNDLPPRYRPRAAFLANGTIYTLIRRFDTGGGASLWVQLADPNPPTLVGKAAYEASALDGAAADGNDILIYGDFSNFLIVDRVGMSIELIPHLFDGDGKPKGTRGLWAMWRNTSLVLVANAFRKLRVGEGS